MNAAILRLASIATIITAGACGYSQDFAELRDGDQIAAYLRSLVPSGDSSWKGQLEVRHPDRTTDHFTIQSHVEAGGNNWSVTYQVSGNDQMAPEALKVVHNPEGSNSYQFKKGTAETWCRPDSDANIPLAGSEFLLTDLGLEFLWWPNQTRLKGELRRGQSCHVLESRPPEGAKAPYSKVVSWIDKDSGGILEAEAYGMDGRKLKEFSVGSFRKVNGVWYLEEMEMRNRRTGARTKIKFEIENDKH